MSVVKLERGSSGTFILAVANADGTPTDLTNAQIIFYLKHKNDVSIPDELSYLVRKATLNVVGGGNDQILVLNQVTNRGQAQIFFNVADTQTLTVLSYAYRYRVHVQPAGLTDYIVLSDKFRLEP